jgi:hypothetical protein
VSARPGQWELLGVDSDPLPGDPYDVTLEARHYNDTARAIKEQVARLRNIAKGSNQLVGDYAPELGKGAGDLADDLDKATGRFETVAAQLTRWSPVLDDGRTQTKTYLDDAVDQQSTISANQPPHSPVDPKDTAATTAEDRRKTAHSDATSALTGIVSRFNTYLDGVHSTAKDVAKQINDAADDKLKNHRFDGFRKWVHDHAGMLKFIADVLTFIATIAIVAVLVLSNPAGWVVGIAFVATLAAMLIHTTLARQGDGSWVDVGLDAFALVTLGGGAAAGALARGARSARLVVAGFGDGSAAFARVSAAARTAFSEAGAFSKFGVWATRSNAVVRTLDGASAFSKAFMNTVTREIPEGASWLSRLSFGEKEAAGLYKDIGLMTGKYGPGFLLNSASDLLNVKRGMFMTGAVVDVTAKIVNPAFPEFWTEGGGTIKAPITNFSEWAEQHTVSSSEGGQ